MIAAISEDRGLGKDNRLLFRIPEDMKHFREITKGHVVIMGRKTFESIGRPLPDRTNIVVTRDPEFSAAGCTVLTSLKDAIEYARTLNDPEIFLIGGAQVYQQGIAFAERLYLTVVHATPDADAFFPEYPDFSRVVSAREGRNDDYQYTFYTLEKPS